jgi:uncharacterized oxidoreductase
MADLPTHTVPVAVLRDFIAAIFVKIGCDDAEAGRIARYLVNANLTGHDSHGVIRTPRYVEDVRTGRTIPGLSVTVVSESPTHAVLEGNNGFGQTVAPQAVEIGIAKAKKAGMAIVTLRHAAHIGRIGEWGEQAANAGLVAIHFVNVENSLLVAPFGGKQRRYATNPVCIAIPPLAGRPMLLMDMATSVVAEGKVMVAANGGKPVPEGALIGTDGKLSCDPSTLYGPKVPGQPFSARNGEGAIRAMGEHKGSALAFMCEILGGLMTGGGTAGPETGSARVCNGMLSIYLDPAHFGVQNLVSKAMEYADYVKTSPTAEGVTEVLVPGEPEARNRAIRETKGIPLQVDTWEHLCKIGKELGLTIPV